MALEFPNIVNSAGSVSSLGAAVSGRGYVAAATAPGVYTLTLDQPVNAAQCAVIVTLEGAAPGDDETVTVEHTSDTVKTVTISHTVIGVTSPVASAFSFVVFQFN